VTTSPFRQSPEVDHELLEGVPHLLALHRDADDVELRVVPVSAPDVRLVVGAVILLPRLRRDDERPGVLLQVDPLEPELMERPGRPKRRFD
jgi:hypothetical protein